MNKKAEGWVGTSAMLLILEETLAVLPLYWFWLWPIHRLLCRGPSTPSLSSVSHEGMWSLVSGFHPILRWPHGFCCVLTFSCYLHHTLSRPYSPARNHLNHSVHFSKLCFNIWFSSILVRILYHFCEGYSSLVPPPSPSFSFWIHLYHILSKGSASFEDCYWEHALPSKAGSRVRGANVSLSEKRAESLPVPGHVTAGRLSITAAGSVFVLTY